MSTVETLTSSYTWTLKPKEYVELAKPRISTMVLITVTLGFLIGSTRTTDWMILLHTLIGVTLAACASNSLNQLIERRTDALMPRTADRPLPSGRLASLEVALFGIFCGIAGITYLFINVNTAAALATLATLLIYVGVYTPLKRVTSFCTAIGAIPGALPPVIGYVAAGQPLDLGAFSLFVIMFLWQFPHFLAIAWLYRQQYHAAGLRMLPGGIPQPGITGFMAVGYALALLPLSLLPYHLGMAGPTYFALAAMLGMLYLAYSVRFMLSENRNNARGLLRCSLIYLPILLIALTWSHLAA